MDKVSIIVPARNERYLSKTVDDLFAKAKGEIEVIVVVDGPTEYQLPKERPGLKFIIKPTSEGLRSAINNASDIATGKYLLKCDAHNIVSEGFDEILKKDCDEDWVVSSSYCKLNVDKWEKESDYGSYDYYYLGCPWNSVGNIFRSVVWVTRDKERKDIKIDDTMTMQGSFYFMTKEHFQKRIGYLDAEKWGSGIVDDQEVSLKTWLSGGRVVVNKNVWNAHYHRPPEERRILVPEFNNRSNYAVLGAFTRYFLNNEWEGQIHEFNWLVEKFWPLPTTRRRNKRERHSWPDNWKEKLNEK